MNNIILIGFMGCGKTSVGQKLAKKLKYSFCDTDQIIEEQCKCSIRYMFETKGEDYFRNLETTTIDNLYGNIEYSVISVGGGLPIREENHELLRRLGQVIYLKTSSDTIKRRLRGDTSRPLLAGDDKDDKIDNLYSYRTPIYESIAHCIIETDNKTIDHIVNDIFMHCN